MISVVLLLRQDPAPEWPVYQCPDSLYRFMERGIFSLFRGSHVWVDVKEKRTGGKNKRTAFAVSTMVYHASYAINSKISGHKNISGDQQAL